MTYKNLYFVQNLNSPIILGHSAFNSSTSFASSFLECCYNKKHNEQIGNTSFKTSKKLKYKADHTLEVFETVPFWERFVKWWTE